MSSKQTARTQSLRCLCHRAAGPINVDGHLQEDAWGHALRSPRFVDMTTGAPTLFDTRAALLWDDECLYIGIWLTETDVRSTQQERTGLVWQENAAEVFISGPGATYELAVNPMGATLEMLYIWKDAYQRGGRYDVPEFDLATHRPMVFGGDAGPQHPRGMRWGFFNWHLPGLRTAVQVDGTLNQREDVDAGWTVELALPWRGLEHLAPAGAAPPAAGDLWRVALARRQIIDQNTAPRAATWTWQQLSDGDLLAPGNYLEAELG
jgi:hypothetical protein